MISTGQMDGSVTNYHQVKIDPTANMSPHCTIVGDVEIGPRCTVFSGVHIRGDNERIVVGAETNVQEGALFHVSAGSPLRIGERVTVGHGAILHGCTVGDESLIGMGSIVMDGAKIGEHCLVGAGALVTGGKKFEDGSLIIGSPARALRKLSEEEIRGGLIVAARGYCQVGEHMTADGALVHPGPGVDIWPPEGEPR
jgi:carbonic anhydrase/acetyltransferase-like protein (isoleucine patch superfamily)